MSFIYPDEHLKNKVLMGSSIQTLQTNKQNRSYSEVDQLVIFQDWPRS